MMTRLTWQHRPTSAGPLSSSSHRLFRWLLTVREEKYLSRSYRSGAAAIVMNDEEDFTVVGAGAVVVKALPRNITALGVPAKVRVAGETSDPKQDGFEAEVALIDATRKFLK